MFLDDMLSSILSLHFVPSLQSAAFCTELLGQHVIIPIRLSLQAPFHAFFIPVPIRLCSSTATYWSHDLGAQPVETHVYNRNTSSHFPKLLPFSFPLSSILNSQAGYRCTLVLRLPVPLSPFPVPTFNNILHFASFRFFH